MVSLSTLAKRLTPLLALWLSVTSAHAQTEPEPAPEGLPATEVAPADPIEAEVQAILADAIAEYDAARYPEALALFRRAHDRAPTARTLRGIGMAAFESGQYVVALRALRASLVETERPLTDAQRDHVRRLTERTEVFVATLAVDASPADAVFFVDGQLPTFEADGTILLDQGHHTVTVEGDGDRSQSLEIDLVGGTERRVFVRADSLGGASVDPLLVSGVVLIVAGGLGAVAAAATGIIASDLDAQLRADCTGFVCPASHEGTRDRARELALVTDLTGSLAAVLMATGTALLIAGVTTSAPPPVSLACTGDGCGLALRGTF